MNKFNKSPSANWEPIPILSDAQTADTPCIIWVWFKPQGVENQVTVSIPPETFQQNWQAGSFTLNHILQAVQVDIAQLARVSYFGSPVEISSQNHPVLHQQLLPPAAGVDPYLHFILAKTNPIASDASFEPIGNSQQMSEHLNKLYRAIETDWAAVRQIESKLKLLRKHLDVMLGRLNSLNRDLSPEENLHADQLDLRAWQDARRWLRDMASRVSRYLKEHDIGMTSNAGNRHRLQHIYEQYIATKIPVEGIDQLKHEFESYRKLIQNLMQSMSSTLSSAKSDGEQRAMQVLRNIASKTRQARVRK